MNIKVVTAPTLSFVSLADAKTFLRMGDITVDDTLIQDCIDDAQDYVEHDTGRTLLSTQYTYSIDTMEIIIELPRYPVQDVTKVEQLQNDGTYVVLNEAQWWLSDVEGGYVTPQLYWPVVSYTHIVNDVLRLTFDAGHTSISDIPGALRRAALYKMADFYTQRTSIPTIDGRYPRGMKPQDYDLAYSDAVQSFRRINV